MATEAVRTATVTRMAPEEAEAVSRVIELVVSGLRYYNDIAKKSEIEKYSAKLLRESIVNDPDSVLVARADGKAVGFCISRYDDSLIWLSWFGVHPEYRRNRLATAILDAFEESVRNGRSHKIWCDCRTENTPSKVILAARGYLPLCTIRNHWYGQDFILWEKLVGCGFV